MDVDLTDSEDVGRSRGRRNCNQNILYERKSILNNKKKKNAKVDSDC